jgi:hypothetical protein
VNFGLRWELLPEFTENQGDIANFDPRNGDVVVPDILLNKTVPSSPLLQANYNAFLISFNACQLPTQKHVAALLERRNGQPGSSVSEPAEHLLARFRSARRHRFPPVSG